MVVIDLLGLGSRLLLLLVGLLFQGRRKDRGCLLIDGLVRLDAVRWERQARDLGGAVWQKQDGGLEVRDLVTRTSLEDRVWLQQLVLDGFNHTHTSLGLVLERTDREWQRRVLGVHLAQHVARRLHLQAVVLVHLALEHGRAALAGQWLLGARRVANVDRVHLVGLECHLWRAVLRVELLRDQLAAVDDEALKLVHERALERLDAVRSLELGQRLGHLQVGVAWLDETRADLHGVVRALEHIGLWAGELWERLLGGRALLGHDGGVRHDGDEAVNVAAQVDLDPVTGLDRRGLGWQRRVVAHDLVHRHAGREGDALLDLLALEDGGAALRDDEVTELAQLDDVLAGHDLREHALQRRLRDLGRETVLLDDIRGAQVLDDLLLHRLLDLLLRVAGVRAFVVRWHGAVSCWVGGCWLKGGSPKWRRPGRLDWIGLDGGAPEPTCSREFRVPHERHTKVSKASANHSVATADQHCRNCRKQTTSRMQGA